MSITCFLHVLYMSQNVYYMGITCKRYAESDTARKYRSATALVIDE